MIELMLLLQMPRAAAVSRAAEMLVVSTVFLVLFIIIALVLVRRLSRSLREENPNFTKDQVLKAKAELLALARKKKEDSERESEMAAKAAGGQAGCARAREGIQDDIALKGVEFDQAPR